MLYLKNENILFDSCYAIWDSTPAGSINWKKWEFDNERLNKSE